MSKRRKPAARPAVDEVLRDAFRAVEVEPVPKALADHVDRLTSPKPRPDRRA